MTETDARDLAMRLAAVEQLRRRAVAGVVSSEDLAAGFTFDGERVPLVNPQRGIFKPRVLRYVLSVRTVFPVTGRKIWYDDQHRVHGQIHGGDELVDYSFMVGGPAMAENRHLHDAMLAGIPIIYFLGSLPVAMPRCSRPMSRAGRRTTIRCSSRSARPTLRCGRQPSPRRILRCRARQNGAMVCGSCSSA